METSSSQFFLMKWGIEATDAVGGIEAGKFLMPEKSLSMHTVCCFWFFEAKETAEVIEANIFFETTQVHKIESNG